MARRFTVGAGAVIVVAAGVVLVVVGNQTTTMWLIRGHLVPLDGLRNAGVGGGLHQVQVGRNWVEITSGALLCVVGLYTAARVLLVRLRNR